MLAAYQHAAYAAQYVRFMADMAERLTARRIGDAEVFLWEVARQLAKLMAYKDEYEVARLYSDPSFIAGLRDQFDGDFKVSVHLAPPLLPRGRDPRTGQPRKTEFGGWIFPLFRLLAKGKLLRGGLFDPFGYTGERRMERALIGEYRALISDLVAQVTPQQLPLAQMIAASPETVSGYGAVKQAGVDRYRKAVAELLARLPSAAGSSTPVLVTSA
jgi:indolepyruvate ferredoxin oxidoreductase